MKQSIIALGISALLYAGAGHSKAGLLDINNQGFEDRVLMPGEYSLFDIPSWEAAGSVSTFYPTDAYFPDGAPEGHNTAAIGGVGGGLASISQLMSDSLTVNTMYTLTVDVGRRLDYRLAPYSVQLLAGGRVLSEGTEPGIPPGEFTTLTVTYTASPDDPQLDQLMQIRFLIDDDGGQVNFDDVKLYVQQFR